MTLDVDYLFDSIKKGDNEYRIEALLDINPDLANCTGNNGFTPLIYATYMGNIATTQLLLKYKADIDKRDAMGNTALMGVSFKGSTAIVKLLLDHGASIDAQNNSGYTALIMAAMYDNSEIVKLLLEHGADKSIKDNEGNAAFDHAKAKGLFEIADLVKF